MKSDVIIINNQMEDFSEALKIAKKTATYEKLASKNALRVQLITEEMLSLARIVACADSISFWIETDGKKFVYHLSSKVVMNQEKKAELLSAATSHKNEAANSFLGKLRDIFENAMLSDADHSNDIPDDIMADLANHEISDGEWDGYERSVLHRLADEIKIGIHGGIVDMTVLKNME
jgi:hypothetical protein